MTAIFTNAIEEFPVLDCVGASPEKVEHLAAYLREVRAADPELLEAEFAAIRALWGTGHNHEQFAAYTLNHRLSSILLEWDAETLTQAAPGISPQASETWLRLAVRLRTVASDIDAVLASHEAASSDIGETR